MNLTKTPTQLRLTHDLLERADALIAVMAADPEVRALGMPTRTAVLRLAIARGLRDLEHQYQPPASADASAPRPTTIPHDATPRARGDLLPGVCGAERVRRVGARTRLTRCTGARGDHGCPARNGGFL
jgi:hypothetical protein